MSVRARTRAAPPRIDAEAHATVRGCITGRRAESYRVELGAQAVAPLGVRCQEPDRIGQPVEGDSLPREVEWVVRRPVEAELRENDGSDELRCARGEGEGGGGAQVVPPHVEWPRVQVELDDEGHHVVREGIDRVLSSCRACRPAVATQIHRHTARVAHVTHDGLSGVAPCVCRRAEAVQQQHSVAPRSAPS